MIPTLGQVTSASGASRDCHVHQVDSLTYPDVIPSVVDLQPPHIVTSNQSTTGTSSSSVSSSSSSSSSSCASSWPPPPQPPPPPLLTDTPCTGGLWPVADRYRGEVPHSMDAFSQWHQMSTPSDHWPSALHYHDGNLYRSPAVPSGACSSVNSNSHASQGYHEVSHQLISTSRQPFEQNEKYLDELEIMQASDIIAFESATSRCLTASETAAGGGGEVEGGGGGGGPPSVRHDTRAEGNCDSMCLHSDSSSACDEYVVTSLDQVTSGLGHLSPDANQLAWGLRRLYQTNIPTQERPRDLLQLSSPQADWREEYLHHQVISCPATTVAATAVKVEPST